MKKQRKILLYIIAFILLSLILLFFNGAYRELSNYSTLISRYNAVHSGFQNLSRQINNAAILNPELIEAGNASKTGNLFFTDSLSIIRQITLLKSLVCDSQNIQIVEKLEPAVRQELSWLLNSNVPDSIIYKTASGHIASFRRIDSLINQGINRTVFLIGYRKQQLNDNISRIRMWMIIFILSSAILLIIVITGFFRQQSRSKRKEEELETFFNRINEAVVSVDNNWRYTFLNTVALSTHPAGKEQTLGKVIWDVHPEMEGTIFWNKYHEAMHTKKVVEIEDYYAPMDIWFSVKVYPSPDGLTIFYKNITGDKKAEQELFATVKEVSDYKFALDESAIVAITDQRGMIHHANDNFCRISKYSRDELIGQDHRIINSGYHSKEFIKDLWATIANGRIWKGELKNKAKDGTIYWVDTTIVPFLNAKGKPYQYVAIRADITERKLAENHLKQSLKETADYKYALEESSIVAITDQKGIIRFANDNFCNISKYSREELIGQDHRIINSGYHPKEFIKDLWATIANGKIWKGEIKNKAKDGSYYWVDTTIVPFLNNEAKPYQYIAIRADITERKELEEKLIQSEKIYKTIASSIPGSVICLLDPDYRYILIEGDMLDKLGYSKTVLLGNKAQDVLSPETFAGVKDDFEKVLTGITVTRESNILGYDIISTLIPLKEENNVVYAIMTVAINVTELKKAQRSINELNRSLEEKITERTAQLKKTNEELEAFSYSVSHDLRAPLRGALAFANILHEEYGNKLDDEARRIISIIKNSTLKMGTLIDDLLAFSRLGKKGINKTQVDSGVMVKETIKDLARQINIKNINWNIHDLPLITADMNMIRQVWINFISNAIKYSGTRQKPVIEIGWYPAGEQVVFYVKDNGVGFDEQFQDKLFKVFQRLHDADEFEGTGVGLALVEKIISRHEGKVWAEGKEGEGACFYFSLPNRP